MIFGGYTKIWMRYRHANWKSTDKCTDMQIEKVLINDRLRVLTVSKVSKFCSILPVKFALFLKSCLLLTVSMSFLFINTTKGSITWKLEQLINAKVSVFVYCVEAILTACVKLR